jgi:hypothetical protein
MKMLARPGAGAGWLAMKYFPLKPNPFQPFRNGVPRGIGDSTNVSVLFFKNHNNEGSKENAAAQRAAARTLLLGVGAGVGIDFGAQRDFDDLG